MGLDLHLVSIAYTTILRLRTHDQAMVADFDREGILTVVVGLITFAILPSSPETARFLNHEQRGAVTRALEFDRELQEEREEFSMSACLSAFSSVHCLLLSAQFFSSGG